MPNELPSAARPLPLAKYRSNASGAAGRLLCDLGARLHRATSTAIRPVPAQRAWAHSGAMALTGTEDGPPVPCPAPLAACLQGAVNALQELSGLRVPENFNPASLLGERSAIAGHRRQGSVSPGGSCRILEAANGHVAINLPRSDDWDLLDALLDGDTAQDWQSLAANARKHSVTGLCERGQLLGLAVVDAAGESCDRHWFEITATGPRSRNRKNAPLVVDLSSLWAGPLCGHLLQQAGARVIKVESTSRPDGARHGPPAFFDLMNGGKQGVALDLTTAAGVEQLGVLIDNADIVIESARPRALQQMGIIAEELVATRPGLTWISITGYGREPGAAMRIAYGDDAAVAAGLSALLYRVTGKWLICGDAIADPLTGAHAALAAWAGWRGGGGILIDIALQAVVASCIDSGEAMSGPVMRSGDQWFLELGGERVPVATPRARSVTCPAPALGADNDRVLEEFPC